MQGKETKIGSKKTPHSKYNFKNDKIEKKNTLTLDDRITALMAALRLSLDTCIFAGALILKKHTPIGLI